MSRMYLCYMTSMESRHPRDNNRFRPVPETDVRNSADFQTSPSETTCFLLCQSDIFVSYFALTLSLFLCYTEFYDIYE